MSDKGAHFHRCDFQVHTPRDQNWKGQNAVTEDERLAYARSLIAACRAQGLDAIAITDHHDMLFVPFVRRAAREETDEQGKLLPLHQRMTVFPGIELTLGVPCQALLILDSDFPDNMMTPLLTALAINPPPDHEPRNGNVTRLHDIHSFVTLKEILDRQDWLRDRYIILPNVSGEGEFSLLRAGQMGKYIEMPCVGGFVDGTMDRLRGGTRAILDGRVREWGNKRIACFQTSDNRYEDHRELGQASTWVKWATPTAEALRQACLAQESRVSQIPPQIPTVFVASIGVTNSAFLGPIELELNAQYNALIGGRGTGKSTILEYLRWALCDQPPEIADEDTPNYQARRARLIDQTLKPLNATVDVRFELNGVPHVVRRSSVDGGLQIKIGDDEMRQCSEDEIRILLPIQAYSQKQLSDVSVRVEELSRFITAPIRSELARREQESNDLAARVRQAYGSWERERALTRAINARELEQRSLSGQADALRAGLTGLSEEDRALLDQGRMFDAAEQTIESWLAGARSIREQMAGLQESLKGHQDHAEPVPEMPERELLTEAQAEYLGFLSTAQVAVADLIERADMIASGPERPEPRSPWHDWRQRFTTFKNLYDAAVQRSSAHTERMQALRRIEEQLSLHIRETARLREELRAVGNAEATFAAARAGWEGSLRGRDDLLDQECSRLTDSANGLIRAQVRRGADAGDFTQALKQYLSGSRVPAAKIDALSQSIITATDPFARWKVVLDDLEKLAEFDPEREAADQRPVLRNIGPMFTTGEIDRIARSLGPEDWLALSLIAIKGVPAFDYRARENDYIPFRNASVGQQATALLKTLLNQAGPPLIIDQPEEDLDNPVMLEVVEQVWQAKQKRQLIFASHNANLVVNGDAELVVYCDYRAAGDQSRGKIAGEGAIDIDDVRDAKKKIMEGGEAAFNLRKAKYGF